VTDAPGGESVVGSGGHVEVLLFGPLAARAGAGRVSVPVPALPLSCGALREAVAQAHPELSDSLPLHRFAVNARFVPEDHPVEAGDEVALIGMVSGG
jgi:molybdopterin converting factor small subunit